MPKELLVSHISHQPIVGNIQMLHIKNRRQVVRYIMRITLETEGQEFLELLFS